MAGFKMDLRAKDADHYIDAITDIIDGNIDLPERDALLIWLTDEQDAARVDEDPDTQGLLEHIKYYLLHHKQYRG